MAMLYTSEAIQDLRYLASDKRENPIVVGLDKTYVSFMYRFE